MTISSRGWIHVTERCPPRSLFGGRQPRITFGASPMAQPIRLNPRNRTEWPGRQRVDRASVKRSKQDQPTGGALGSKGCRVRACEISRGVADTPWRTAKPRQKSAASARNLPCPDKRQIEHSSSSKQGGESSCERPTPGDPASGKEVDFGLANPTKTYPPGNSTAWPQPGTRCQPSPTPAAKAKSPARSHVIVARVGKRMAATQYLRREPRKTRGSATHQHHVDYRGASGKLSREKPNRLRPQRPTRHDAPRQTRE
jgi:hypothetical protein